MDVLGCWRLVVLANPKSPSAPPPGKLRIPDPQSSGIDPYRPNPRILDVLEGSAGLESSRSWRPWKV